MNKLARLWTVVTGGAERPSKVCCPLLNYEEHLLASSYSCSKAFGCSGTGSQSPRVGLEWVQDERKGGRDARSSYSQPQAQN
jgi:hypothetical protein